MNKEERLTKFRDENPGFSTKPGKHESWGKVPYINSESIQKLVFLSGTTTYVEMAETLGIGYNHLNQLVRMLRQNGIDIKPAKKQTIKNTIEQAIATYKANQS